MKSRTTTSVRVSVPKSANYRAKVKYMNIEGDAITGTVLYVEPGYSRWFYVDAFRTVFVSHQIFT